MKILIIKPSALGDIVQALPVLTGLKRAFPTAEIDWIVNDTLEELLQGHPCLRRTIPYPRKRWTGLHRLPEIYRWSKRLAAEKYDITLDLQGLLRSGLMTWAANSEHRIGLQSAREGARAFYNEIVDDNALSAAERYLTCLEHLGVAPQPLDFQLSARVPRPEGLEDPYIALHPYSKWRTKLWPWRYYQDLVDSMPGRRFAVVGEGPWFPLSSPGRLLDLRGKLSISQLVAVLDGAQAVLSTDSGPAHIAAALGRPTMVLFGATDWRRTRPIGLNVSIHTAGLFCSPCLKRKCWRDTRVECMSQIETAHVSHFLATL
jgi:lipopolysaccharide heptosyltransferase I